MNITKENCIIICPPTKKSVHKILDIMNNHHFKWVYFGEDVLTAINIEKLIGGEEERIDITDKLQDAARSSRRSYIDYIGELNIGLPNWWITTISEKNSFISKTFLHICYLKVCKELLEVNNLTHLVIFVENSALRETILKEYSELYKFKYIYNKSDYITDAFKFKLKDIAIKTYCILINIYYILIIKYYYRLNSIGYTHLLNKPLILLRDWIDHRSFDSKGHYQSAYLGKLNEYLKSNNNYVVILPHICNINKKTIKQFIKSNESFIIPHSFLSIFNVFSKLFIKTPVLKSYPVFEDMDITYLIQDDFKKDKDRFMETLLYNDMIKNLKNLNFCFQSCIYPYENLIHEKMFCIAMKMYYSSTTKLIGYQHSTAPRMLLPYFFSKKDRKEMPLPDRIITNGHFFTRLFKEEGYPDEKVITGSAIRYQYLYNNYDFKYFKNCTRSTYNILVTPSIDINETLELIIKITQTFGENQKYKVIIKYHPIINTKITKKYIQSFPSNVHVSAKPVAELLKNSDIMIYSNSSACIEALYVGIPVLHVKSSYFIDSDMFNYEQNNMYSARNVKEIKLMADELLQMDEEELKSNQAIWKKIVEDMFYPVDGHSYELFNNVVNY